MVAGVVGRMIFRGESFAALLLARPAGSAPPGTNLVYNDPSKPPSNKTLPTEALNPVKLPFETLGGWTYVEGSPIPADVKKFDGQWVKITGYMMQSRQVQNISSFITVQSLWSCCFGQTPAVNHVVAVTMEPGKFVGYYPEPVDVMGKFSVGEYREGKNLVSVYRLEAVSVSVK